MNLRKRKRVLLPLDFSGAITLETTLVMAAYLTLTVPLISLGNIAKMQFGIQMALENVARDLAQKAHYTSKVIDSDVGEEAINKLVSSKLQEELKNGFIGDVAFQAAVYSDFVSQIGIDNI
ncbi:MAG: hypothetical protein IKN54_00550, partial [Lachnospiraceae bacterium]|nr:hypothetical protein [Lachnospiraceae bacterium]